MSVVESHKSEKLTPPNYEHGTTTVEATLTALKHMTAARDPYTDGHENRVGELAAAIATRLGMNDRESDLIRLSGEVHDLGKVAVPVEILSYPGNLDAQQFEIVKRHPVVGGEILTSAGLPHTLAQVALQHHERLNGSGYPYGLSGVEIVTPARIVAVADVLEAVSQHRPYRAGLGIDTAVGILIEGIDNLYDRDVVSACITVLGEGFTFSQYRHPALGVD